MSSSSILDLVGNTPLIPFNNLHSNPKVKLFVKLEYANPSGSIKDRIVKYIISEAEKSRELVKGGTIVESTTGNTGASIAMIAKLKGYKAILTIPSKVSKEKHDTMIALGAKVIVCPNDAPPDSDEYYVNKAKQIAQSIENSFVLNQYHNLKNAVAHYMTTGPEIWNQTDGEITHFIAGGSTGGTITGTSKYLKEKNSKVQSIMPDPKGSIYYDIFHKNPNPSKVSSYFVEGVGEDHMSSVIDFSYIDDVVQFTDKEAFDTCNLVADKEGVLSGGSGGGNIWASLKLINSIKTPATVVTVVPDNGIKYLSKIYNPEWLKDNIYHD